MRSVAQKLGVTPMALYYYVDDKEALLGLVVQHVSSSWEPLRSDGDWRESLRRHLLSMWDVLSMYPGLGSHLIELPSLGVTPESMRQGFGFFERAGFDATTARLAWSFAYTYIHGRMSVDAHLGHRPDTPRIDRLKARDFVEFGLDAVIAGLEVLRDRDAASGLRPTVAAPGLD
jgi:AcrR family transcriptional regulator